MPGVVLNAGTGSLVRAVDQVNALHHRASDLTDLNEAIGAYLVSTVRNRIYSSKTDPDGKRWAPNSELTVALKGSASVLFHTGELASSVRVTDADRGGVTIAATAPYASYVQSGRTKTRGRYRSDRPVPERKFMGISEANRKRIAKMIREHIASRAGSGDEMEFGG